ncbi:MAG: hypothetical protein QW350_05790 [Candidatus Aenigmatarchaeota archaeon]|jgi:hypothetical protein
MLLTNNEKILPNPFGYSSTLFVYDSFVFILAHGVNFKNEVPLEMNEEIANIIFNGFRAAKSLGVDSEDMFGIDIYVKREKSKEIMKMINDTLVEMFSTGTISEIPIGFFPVVNIEFVSFLPKNLNLIVFMKFCDNNNIPNDGTRHFEISNIPSMISPRDYICSSYAVANNHVFSAPIFNCTLAKNGWVKTENIQNSWNLLFRKSLWVGATSNQLYHITIQMKNIDSQWPETQKIIESIFPKKFFPALDVFEGDEYCITPRWFFGTSEPNASFTNKGTVQYMQSIGNINIPVKGPYSPFVKVGPWIFSSFIPCNSDISQIVQIVNSLKFKVVFIKFRVVEKEYESFLSNIQNNMKKINQTTPPLVIVVPCKKLLLNDSIHASLTFIEKESE